MGIRETLEEERREEARKKMNLIIEAKNFAEVGYWLRDIKRKLKNTEIEKIRIDIEATYIKYEKDDKLKL